MDDALISCSHGKSCNSLVGNPIHASRTDRVEQCNAPRRAKRCRLSCARGRDRRCRPCDRRRSGASIDAKGYLVSPPFVDAHFHMDATLSLGHAAAQPSGTLLEGIALWGELKPLPDPRGRDRARPALLRSRGGAGAAGHPHPCRCLRRPAARASRRSSKSKKVAPYLDLQIVAFPQDGYFRSPTAAANLERALDMGVDVVGGIPHFERTMADGASEREGAVRDRCRARAPRRHALR